MGAKASLLERLDKGIVLGAEGYIFELERRGYVQAGPYVPTVVIDYPGAVKELHREFLLAGAEVMVALTYYAHRDKLRTVGREDELERLNRHALRLAREVADEGDALLAGNICNSWVYDHDRPEETGEAVRAMYHEQVAWAADEGADFIIAETLDYLGEALIALDVIHGFGLPAVVTFGSVRDDTKEGVSLADACQVVDERGAEVVGLNCSRGPATMLPIVHEIRQRVSCFVAAQPVAYRTTPQQSCFQALREPDRDRGFPIALDPFQATRFDMADFAAAARDLGVNYIGTCCGAAPHHVRAMAEALGRRVPASKYSPDLSLHPMLGNRVKLRDVSFLGDWKD